MIAFENLITAMTTLHGMGERALLQTHIVVKRSTVYSRPYLLREALGSCEIHYSMADGYFWAGRLKMT